MHNLDEILVFHEQKLTAYVQANDARIWTPLIAVSAIQDGRLQVEAEALDVNQLPGVVFSRIGQRYRGRSVMHVSLIELRNVKVIPLEIETTPSTTVTFLPEETREVFRIFVRATDGPAKISTSTVRRSDSGRIHLLSGWTRREFLYAGFMDEFFDTYTQNASELFPPMQKNANV